MEISIEAIFSISNTPTREDQLGVSLLTVEQLETKEMQDKIQQKVQQG